MEVESCVIVSGRGGMLARYIIQPDGSYLPGNDNDENPIRLCYSEKYGDHIVNLAKIYYPFGCMTDSRRICSDLQVSVLLHKFSTVSPQDPIERLGDAKDRSG